MEVVDKEKTSISTITIKQVTPKMVKLKTLIIQRLKIKTTSLLSCKRKSHTITSYKEVKQSDIPTKAKEKL